MIDYFDLIKAFFILFIAMDPVGNTPVFVILMEKLKKRERKQSALKALVVASIVLLLFLFFGLNILSVFNITMNHFEIAGGIILLIFGLKITMGLRITERRAEAYDVAVVPIAIPLITGPVVITLTMLLVNMYGYLITLIAAVVNLLLSYIVIRNSDLLFRVIGRQGSDVLSRLVGILLTAVAVGLIQMGGLF